MDGPEDRAGGGRRRGGGLPLPLEVLRSSRDRKSPMGSDDGCDGLLRCEAEVPFMPLVAADVKR